MAKIKRNKPSVKNLLEDGNKLEQGFNNWKIHYQRVAEFVLQRKATFNVHEEPGSFIHSEIWTDHPAKSMDTAASAFLALVWPDNKSFKLEPIKEFDEDQELKDFFAFATKYIQNALDDPKAGLDLALTEIMIDYFAFGTPALYIEQGEETDYRFEGWNVSQFRIKEGSTGFVNEIHRFYILTVGQIMSAPERFDASKKVRDMFAKGNLEAKIKVRHIIRPRKVNPNGGIGPLNMPFASFHIDQDNKKMMRESGYNEFPAPVARFSKRIGEVYGRSPAMRALPSITELNVLWELVTVAAEKNLDPPLGVINDGVAGNGTIDTSAGAINVLNIPIGSNIKEPVQPLFTVGSFNDVAILIERLEATVDGHFMIDSLIDLTNEKQMTLGEFVRRQSIRQAANKNPVTRILAEIFTPSVERLFNMGLRNNKFGFAPGSPEAQAWEIANPGQEIRLLPEKIVQMQGSGKRIYRVKYLSPAVLQQLAQEAQGILNTYEFIGGAAEIAPQVIDEINHERATRHLGGIWSVPEEIWNSKKEKEAIQDQRQAAAEQQQGLQTAQVAGSVVKDLSQAQKGGQSAQGPR